mgnify:CR=1 FL=1
MQVQSNQPEQAQATQSTEPEVKVQEQPKEPVQQPQQPKQFTHQNPMVRMAVNTLAQSGFDPNDPLVQDAINGNTAGLARVLYQQGIKGGWDVIEALDANHKQQQEFQSFQKQSSEYALQEAMGGKDRWSAIQEWAMQAGSPEEVEQVKQDLAAGGRTALRTAQWLETMFNAAGGQVKGVEPKPDPQPINPASMQPQQVKTYSPKEFRKELLRIRNTQGPVAAEAFFLQHNPN